MRPRKTFLYFLCNPVNAGSFYVDDGGAIRTTNGYSYVDADGVTRGAWLQKSPDGWFGAQLKFARNSHYNGINRSFSIPLKFVDDGAAIIRNQFYNKRGIEQLLQLVVLKWNPDTDVYELYYKGMLDLSNLEDMVAEGVNVNVMEGGVIQLLKAYDKTVFEIPCDGSIPENIKVNLDGILFDDIFHYQIPSFQVATPPIGVLGFVVPAVFTSNDGDNIGVVKGQPTYEDITTGSWFATSPNYLFSSQADIQVRIRGYIIVKPTNPDVTNFQFYLALATSKTGYAPGTDNWGLTNTISLIPAGVDKSASADSAHWVKTTVLINGEIRYDYDATINLSANENLFLTATAIGATITGGFDLIFSSKYEPTTVWGITAKNLFKKIVEGINTLSSTSAQTFSYEAVSSLLDGKPNIIYTSGDAIRASGDPNYLKYFNKVQTNAYDTSYQFFNYYRSYGPVIKISLSDFFDDIHSFCHAALGNQQPAGQRENIFIEEKQYVFDSSVITMDIGEVSNLRFSPALDYFFTNVEVGYAAQQYDEKQGKYEYNTTAQWQAPVKAIPNKKVSILAKARADSYGIEYTRFNIQGRSTTYNNSDNSFFRFNINTSSSALDVDTAKFTAVPVGDNNGNAVFVPAINAQGVSLPDVTGTYLRPYNTGALFIFNQAAPGSRTVKFTFAGTISASAVDTFTIIMYINGLVAAQISYAGTVVNFSDNISVTHNFSKGDIIYVLAVTSDTCTATITTCDISVDAGSYFEVSSVADNVIQPGTPGQLVEMNGQPSGTYVTIGGVNYYQLSNSLPAFILNEILNAKTFSLSFAATGLIQGTGNLVFTIYIIPGYIGLQESPPASLIKQTITVPATATQTSFSVQLPITPGYDFNFGDVILVIVDVGSGCNAQMATGLLTLQSLKIQVFDLLRNSYSSVLGIPNAYTAYNIEEFTPKRMLVKHGPTLAASLFNLVPDKLTFLTLDKNKYLATTDANGTIAENADIAIADLGTPLFYAIEATFNTKVPLTFQQLLTGAANGHIKFSYDGKDMYGFPVEVMQKAVLNDSQEWKLLLSPLTNLSDLVDLNIDGINYLNLMANEIHFSHVNPIKWVPLNKSKDPRYHFIHMDEDWFINQVNFWVFKRNYYQPWEKGDVIWQQCFTGGSTPPQINLLRQLDDNSMQLITSYTWTLKPTAAVKSPLALYELQIPLNTLDEGYYYLVSEDGTGAPIISEGLQVKNSWPMTLLFEYSNSINKQSTVFSTGYAPCMRVEGWIDKFNPEAKFAVYEDQPADLEMLNGIPYRTHQLQISAKQGIPDWVVDKVNRIMLLTNVSIDDLAFTRDDNAKWEAKETDLWPRRYWNLQIREAENRDGVTFNNDGIADTTTEIIYNIDASAFGDNGGVADVIQVTQIN